MGSDRAARAMKGIILAAGRGSRLGDATEALPKPLMPVGNRVCIDFAIAALAGVVEDIIVVTGYRAELVEAHLAARWSGAAITAIRNPDLEAGNLTSLRAARPLVEGGGFIVTNADHLFPPDMYSRFFTPIPDAVRIACERSRPILDDEMKVVDHGGRLAAISKTLPAFDGAYIGTTAVGGTVANAYWAAFDRVHAEKDLGTASVEMVLDELARGESPPAICWIEGLKWFEVDTQEDLAIARQGLAT